MTASVKDLKNIKCDFYQIKVEGNLHEDWSDWFNGMQITDGTDIAEFPITTLTGKVTDQPSLRGILCKLWDLNLILISVLRLEAAAERKEGKSE